MYNIYRTFNNGHRGTNNLNRPSNNAHDVYVCGSFDNWSSRHRLEPDSNRRCFTGTVDIDPHDAQKVYYKFIVDDKWVASECDAIEVNESGILNNVITLKSSDNADESVVMIRDSDGESAFTSISYPNDGEVLESEAFEREQDQDVEPEVDSDYDDDHMNASTQITIKDSSSVNGSIPSIQPSVHRINSQIGIKKSDSYTIIGRIRNIFHHG